MSEAHSMVTARWSLALEEEHHERFFSSTYHSDTAIYTNAIIAACLPGCGQKNPAQGLYAALANHAVRRDTVNGVSALAGVIRTELGE